VSHTWRAWLRCIAATYPRFCPRDDLPPGIPAAVDAITRAPHPQVVLTRVGLERPELAEAVDAFIKAADTEEADTKAADKTVTVAWDSALRLRPLKLRARPCGYWLAASEAPDIDDPQQPA